MTARRECARLAVELAVSTWMYKHPGRFWRIVDVANGTNLPLSAVNNALRSMHTRGSLDREERRKAINGKIYPVYQMTRFRAPAEAPAWLCPQLPEFADWQIKGAHRFSCGKNTKNRLTSRRNKNA